MSTNSTIALLHREGHIGRIYCHFNGYIEHGVGEMLYKNYNDYDKIEYLISFGSIVYLENQIDPTDPSHSFLTPQDGVCVFYCRDRGENFSRNIYTDILTYLRKCEYFPYNYIYMPHIEGDTIKYEWYVVKNDINRTSTKLSSYFIK